MVNFSRKQIVSISGALALVTAIASAQAPVYTRNDSKNAYYQPQMTPDYPTDLPSPAAEFAPAQQQVQRGSDSDTDSMDQMTLINRVAELEESLRQLRGQIEMQQHELDQVQKGQQQFYVNLDHRINQLSSATTTATAAAAATAVSQQPARSSGSTPEEHPAQPVVGMPANKPSVQQSQPINQSSNNIPMTEDEARQVMQQQREYEQAYQLLRSKQYSQATAYMQQYLQHYPNGQYAANAHYWIGELSLISGQTQQARQEFNTVINNYTDSTKAPDAMLKLAMLDADNGQPQQARKQLQLIQERYPNSTAAQLAQQQMKQLSLQGR